MNKSKYPYKSVEMFDFEGTWLEDRAEEKGTTVAYIMEYIVEVFGDDIKAGLCKEEF